MDFIVQGFNVPLIVHADSWLGLKHLTYPKWRQITYTQRYGVLVQTGQQAVQEIVKYCNSSMPPIRMKWMIMWRLAYDSEQKFDRSLRKSRSVTIFTGPVLENKKLEIAMIDEKRERLKGTWRFKMLSTTWNEGEVIKMREYERHLNIRTGLRMSEYSEQNY